MAVPDSTADYAVEVVPPKARLAWPRVMIITLGVMGAMVFPQLAGQITVTYGVGNAVISLIYATVVTGVLATILAYVAAKHGLNCNLITRACGFGYGGARITGLFYTANFIALAATEGAIMAYAIHEYVKQVPLPMLMVLITLFNIGLNWYGITFLEKFQRYSLPAYLTLLVIAIVIANQTPPSPDTSVPEGVSFSGVLSGAGILNGVVALQALLTADYARFTKTPKLPKMILIGFVPQISSFLIMGLVGIWFATRFGEPNPGVYLVLILGFWGAVYTVLSQIRINVINIYSGSVALEGVFSSFKKSSKHRALWVISVAVIALLAMLFGILDRLDAVMTFLGSFMFAWVGTLVAELLVSRRLRGLSSKHLEFHAGQIRAWGPTGLSATLAGAVCGGYCALFSGSASLVAASGFISAGVAIITDIILALVTALLTTSSRM